MKHVTYIVLFLFLILSACEQKKKPPEVKTESKPAKAIELKLPKPKMIFNEPMTAHRFELPSEALEIWRHAKPVKPTLVLFSIHPLLNQVGDLRKEDVSTLIRTGDADSFRQRGSINRINPALIPTQTLSVAIDNEIFTEIVWVIPTRLKHEELSLEIFQKQVVEAGFLTAEEGKNLSYDDGVASGTVRGVPFRAVHPDRLPDLKEPVVIHIDTGYFKGMFKNEVSSPLYDILHQTVMRIMQSEWNAYLVTLSYSTEEFMFSLDVRFLISALAKMIENPEIIQNMPASWKLHAEAMYMGNMYMESKSRDIVEEAAVADPNDPAIVYALSQVRFQQNRPVEAFALVDSAVKLDPGYAPAYLQLAITGAENGQLEKSLELTRKAIQQYPENPFLKVNEVDLLIQLKQTVEAIEIIEKLQKLKWSDYFHPDAQKNLENMIEYARNPQPARKAGIGQEKKP